MNSPKSLAILDSLDAARVKIAAKPNNSYYNACILYDTGNNSMLDVKARVKPESYGRLTCDACGNITAIDGRKVERRRLNLFFTYCDEYSLAE